MNDASLAAVSIGGMDLLTIAKTYHMGTRRVLPILRRDRGWLGEQVALANYPFPPAHGTNAQQRWDRVGLLP